MIQTGIEHRIKHIGHVNKYIKDTVFALNIHEIFLKNVGVIYPKAVPQPTGTGSYQCN